MRSFRLAAMLFLAGCGKLRLDEATVDEHLDRIDASVPLCTSEGGAPSAARVVGKEVNRLVEAARSARPFVGAALPGYRSSGSCGGSLDAVSEHANGTTDYELTFAAYCLHSDEGDVVVDGTVRAREEGTPSDSGPVVSALESSTDGPLVVTSDVGTMELRLEDARTQYGIPAAWAPSPPDEQHPDMITVGEFSATFPDDDDRKDYVRGVRMERVGSPSSVITIVHGEAGTAGEGHVNVRTLPEDPVVFDFGQLQVTSGTVELVGAGGTVVTVQRDPLVPAALVLTLDGEPYDRGLDCSAARLPLAEVGLALLLELPIH